MDKQNHTAIPDVKYGTHPFGIPMSTDNELSSQETTCSVTEVAEQGNVCKRSGKQNGYPQLCTVYVCIASLFVICMGLLGGLIWTISNTGQQSDYYSRINALEEKLQIQEKINDKYISRIDALMKQFPNQVTAKAASPKTELVSASSKTKTSMISTITSPQMTSIITMADRSTTTTTRRSTTMPRTSALTTTTTSTSTTTSPYPFAFRVLQAKTVTYKDVEFLALQVRLPDDGLSKSENWCRDYELLCAEYHLLPTGCGANKRADSLYKECNEEYASIMHSDNILGCNPSHNIAQIANISFPNSPIPPSSGRNAFGFHMCGPSQCNSDIRYSDYSISYVRDFWESDKRVMYTVCLRIID